MGKIKSLARSYGKYIEVPWRADAAPAQRVIFCVLYFDNADKLLRSRVLPRKVYEKTVTWMEGADNEKLMARACGLVFLINKLNGSNSEIGLRSTIDTLADLLVEDLAQGSSALRSQLPSLLDQCELLIRVGDEYRIQTEESAAWQDDFLTERNNLANEAHRIDAEREDRLRQRFAAILKKVSLTQGQSKTLREVSPIVAAQLPPGSDQKISIWMREGWSSDENSAQADAREAGNQSPVIFAFIPKRSGDDLRSHLITYKAAAATLEKWGVPNTPEGTEARTAMETLRLRAEAKIQELLDEAFSGARVFQGGGNEILAGNRLRAEDEGGKTVDPKALERKGIGKTLFRAETTTIATYQRLQIRKLLQKAGIAAKQGEESGVASQFLARLLDLAARAGGEAPKPKRPDVGLLEEIRLSSGNDQLLALYHHREALSQCLEQWKGLAEKIEARWPAWEQLQRLARHAQAIPEAGDWLAQIEHFREQRQLLEDPDPVQPLLNALTQILRTELNRYQQIYDDRYQNGLKLLEQDSRWERIEPERKTALLSQASLQSGHWPAIAAQTPEDVLNTLEQTPLKVLADRVAALPTRFAEAQTEAAKHLTPESQLVRIPRRTLKTGEDIDQWIKEVQEKLQAAIEKGPIILQ